MIVPSLACPQFYLRASLSLYRVVGQRHTASVIHNKMCREKPVSKHVDAFLMYPNLGHGEIVSHEY